MVYGSDLITKSGWPSSLVAFHSFSAPHCTGAGMSLASPIGAPASTQLAMVAICSSDSEISFLNFCTPAVLSMCQGGIWRVTTRCLMALAQGRGLLIGHQRHGGQGPFVIALLAARLQNRGDILGESHRFSRWRRARGRSRISGVERSGQRQKSTEGESSC